MLLYAVFDISLWYKGSTGALGASGVGSIPARETIF